MSNSKTLMGKMSFLSLCKHTAALPPPFPKATIMFILLKEMTGMANATFLERIRLVPWMKP